MSGNAQMKDMSLLSQKPYLTRSELELLWSKAGRNLDKAILKALKNNDLVSLKKGMYLPASRINATNQNQVEFIANSLCYPSYLSLEYILQLEKVIPESVFVMTSITTGKTISYTNALGQFQYRSLKPALFTGFVRSEYQQEYQIKRATLAKALFDWLYLQPFPRSKKDKRQILADARLNYTSITQSDLDEFSQYVAIDHSSKMTQLQHILTEEVHHAH